MITNTGSKRCYLTKNCPRVQGQGSWLKPGTWPHWAEFHHFCTSIWQGGFGFLSWQDGSGFQKAFSWKHYLQSSLKPSISKLKSFQTTSYCGTIQKHVWQAKMNPSISQIRKTSPIGREAQIFFPEDSTMSKNEDIQLNRQNISDSIEKLNESEGSCLMLRK